MGKNCAPTGRFYGLDVLRGIAAICVVFAHWHHFIIAADPNRPFYVMQAPLSSPLFIFYYNGNQAVDLFFCLSGFVFYWLYSERITLGLITLREFVWLRFSRLYPLHFSTLLIVAVCQYLFYKSNGHYFIASNTDLRHFLLNLFFIESWGAETGMSFNLPAWSVSAEVLLYILFFSCCRMISSRFAILLGIAALGLTFVNAWHDPVGRGVGSFFLGGSVFLLYRRIVESGHMRTIYKWVSYLALYTWTGVLIANMPNINFDIDKTMTQWFSVIFLFPLTVLSVALIETRYGAFWKRFTLIGDISYSIYLIHFPLQLLFYAVTIRFTSDDSVFYSPWFMASFFGTLLPLATLSYMYFEMPMQRYLRRNSRSGLHKHHDSCSR